MIIRGVEGDDEEIVAEMESRLCRKYRLSRKLLYPALGHADFHSYYKDPARFWSAPAYAAFSGTLLPHTLAYEQLNALLADFAEACDAHAASWNRVSVDAIFARSGDRRERDHVAAAYRYTCAVADDYRFPNLEFLGQLTPAQFAELDAYLNYISKERLIPACKQARQACQRQINDLSRAGV
jgi:hypothetical protein